jgi:predicted flavoprotein YhiN
MNPIEFFMTWGFVPEEYKSFNIPNQSLFVEVSKNFEANSSFIKKDNRYYFNEDLIFKKEEIPTNINNFLKIFPNNQSKKIFDGIMDSYEKSINTNLMNKILEKECSITLTNFCKSIRLYIENIRLYKLLLTL